jgi:amino acid transporter
MVCLCYNYSVFKDFTAEGFFRGYTMQVFMPLLFVGWKLIKKTRFVRPHEADLIWEAPTIDRYESQFTHDPPGFWTEMGWMVGINRGKKHAQD